MKNFKDPPEGTDDEDEKDLKETLKELKGKGVKFNLTADGMDFYGSYQDISLLLGLALYSNPSLYNIFKDLISGWESAVKGGQKIFDRVDDHTMMSSNSTDPKRNAITREVINEVLREIKPKKGDAATLEIALEKIREKLKKRGITDIRVGGKVFDGKQTLRDIAAKSTPKKEHVISKEDKKKTEEGLDSEISDILAEVNKAKKNLDGEK